MENNQEAMLETAGSNHPAVPQDIVLEKPHDDIDTLEGNPRNIHIGGLTVTQKAFKNRQFHNIQAIIIHFGFGLCDTEEEIDALTLDELYQTCCASAYMYGQTIDIKSFDDFLYTLIQWPEDMEKIPFEEVLMQEFRAFLGHIVEQNNLMPFARKRAKKNLELKRQEMSQAL